MRRPPRPGRPDFAAFSTLGHAGPLASAVRDRQRDHPRSACLPVPGSAGESLGPKVSRADMQETRWSGRQGFPLIPAASPGARAGRRRRRDAPHARGRRARRPRKACCSPRPRGTQCLSLSFPSLSPLEQTTLKVDNGEEEEEETSVPRTHARLSSLQLLLLSTLAFIGGQDSAVPYPGRRNLAAASSELTVPGATEGPGPRLPGAELPYLSGVRRSGCCVVGVRWSRQPWEPSRRRRVERRDFSGLCPRGCRVILLQVPGTGGPANSEPPGSLCRGCASQSRLGSSLGSGRLRAKHVGFTTAQNTSVCGVYEREGREREVTSEPECRVLFFFLATSLTSSLAQLLKVSLSFLPSSVPPSFPPSPSLSLSLSLPSSRNKAPREELGCYPAGRGAPPGADPSRIRAAAPSPAPAQGSEHLAPCQAAGSHGLDSLAFCPSGTKVDCKGLPEPLNCPDTVAPT